MGKLIRRTLFTLFLIAAVAGVLFAFVPVTTVKQMAVRTGLIENTYYHEGDTEWDNGGVEEY